MLDVVLLFSDVPAVHGAFSTSFPWWVLVFPFGAFLDKPLPVPPFTACHERHDVFNSVCPTVAPSQSRLATAHFRHPSLVGLRVSIPGPSLEP